MTTIREFFTPDEHGDLDDEFDEERYGEVYVNAGWALEALGIDPDLPAEWATVDRCLTWLRAQGFQALVDNVTSVHKQVAVATRIRGTRDEFDMFKAPTLHAALIAACKAVQEAS